MPEKTKTYSNVIFMPEVINQIVDSLEALIPEKERKFQFQI